jgi:predicted nuclease of predicted toxin-antitoxin system
MNLVADEGVDKAIVDALRADGFSVKYFAEVGGGSTDKEVLAAANDAQSLLLTCDKDFGELVFRQRQVHAGVVLIRLTGVPASSRANLVLEAIKLHGLDMGGAFTVISPGLLRVRHREPRPPPT